MARVALVNPQLASSGWRRGLPHRHMDDVLPRHSLTLLSASLKAAGHKVQLLDFRLMSGWGDYEAALASGKPEFVCVTAHTLECPDAIECFRRARQALPGCVTIGGGIHFTMFPGAALDNGFVDFVIRGEGEVSLAKLVDNPGGFPQAFWGEVPDLNDIPFEDRELYPDYRERVLFPLWDLPTPLVDVLTQRGCPWECRFCCGPGEQNLFTRPAAESSQQRVPALRRRSVANVIAELKHLHDRYGFRSVVFHDDQFLVREDWVVEFCRALHDAGFVKRGLRWWAASRADMVCAHPDTIARMREAGLQILSLGFESFSDRMLEWMRKGTTRKQNFRAAEICHTLGVDIFANVILGMPFSDARWSLEDDLATLDAIRRIHPRYFSPAFFSPIPGSWFYDWAVQHDLLIEDRPAPLGSRTPRQAKVQGVDGRQLAARLDRFRKEMGYAEESPKGLRSRLKGFMRRPLAEKATILKRKLAGRIPPRGER